MSSLVDALLLEPYPFETWVAYRSGSTEKGSGTRNDPLNGAPKLATPFTIGALVNTGGGQEATATAAGHTFANGDVVIVTGVAGIGAAQWNGAFAIYGVSGNTFKYYMTGVPAATADLNAGPKVSKVTAFPFDDRMSELPVNSRIHLGPTPPGEAFLTRGYADGVNGGWQVKAGMKISGAGADTTVIKLVPSAVANAHFFAVGHALTTGNPAVANLVDFFELSDVTMTRTSRFRRAPQWPAGQHAFLGITRGCGV